MTGDKSGCYSLRHQDYRNQGNLGIGTAPICVTEDDTNALALKAATTTTKLTITAAAMDSDKVRWICIE